VDFFEILQKKFAATGARLNHYFGSRAQTDAVIIPRLKEEFADAIAGNVEIVRYRTHLLGISIVAIAKKSRHRIIVELAGHTDIDSIKPILEKPALLEFKLVEEPAMWSDVLIKIDKMLSATPKGAPSNVAETDVPAAPMENYHAVDSILNSPSVQMLIPQEAEFAWSNKPEKFADADYYRLYLLKKKSELTGSFLAEAYATEVAPEYPILPSAPIEVIKETLRVGENFYLFDPRLFELAGYHLINPRPSLDGQKSPNRQGKWVVNIKLSDEDAKIFSVITKANLNAQLAIVLDKRVVIAPKIGEIISQGMAQIEGNMNAGEAKNLSSIFRAASLPAPMKVVEVRAGRSSQIGK
jgi:protein-export membrane protein SecD